LAASNLVLNFRHGKRATSEATDQSTSGP